MPPLENEVIKEKLKKKKNWEFLLSRCKPPQNWKKAMVLLNNPL